MVALFVGMVVADAAACQVKTDHSGKCWASGICCHIIGALDTTPLFPAEQVTAYVPVSDAKAAVLLVSTIFHPPRA